MAVIFNPHKIVGKVLPKDSDDLLTQDLKFKDKFKRSLLRLDFITNKDIKHTIDGSLKFYKSKMKQLKAEGETAGEAKAQALNNGKLLKARLSDLIVEKASNDIREKYAGKKFIWLPSDAENPDIEHMLNYGKTFEIDKGDENGQIPGQRHGCKCGMEILTDDEDAPDIYQGKSRVKNITPSLPLYNPTYQGVLNLLDNDFAAKTSKLINDVRNEIGLDKVEPFAFRKIVEVEAARLKKDTGLDLKHREHQLINNEIRHTIKNHGSAATEIPRGQIPVKLQDFMLVSEITSNYDKAYLSPDLSRGRKVIVYEKAIEDINYFYAEAINNNGALTTVTMYKRKVKKVQTK